MTKQQELTPNQTQWIAALRSGNYAQTTGRLHDIKGFCCLGVAAVEFLTDDVKVEHSHGMYYTRYEGETAEAPLYVIMALSLNDSCGASSEEDDEPLVRLNDDGKTFSEIADILEANPGHYFKATTQTGDTQ
jgi:hypothetical protein